MHTVSRCLWLLIHKFLRYYRITDAQHLYWIELKETGEILLLGSRGNASLVVRRIEEIGMDMRKGP
jgi:hypothetical protein